MGMIVDSMLQEQTVNIIVGDSGIGKSPLLVQLALCVSLGRPFLDLPTRQCNVLYVDFENSAAELDRVMDQLSEFLSIDGDPPAFRVLQYPENKTAIELEIKAFQPKLVIVDALRGLDPKAEKDAEATMLCLDWLHKKSAKYHAAFLVLHHTRKPDQKDPPPKLSALSHNVMAWLLQASGSRALVNQTEARFAIEDSNLGDASLIMRGHVKLTGEVGPWYIERVYDPESDTPLGYKQVSGLQVLSQADRERYLRLPQRFNWTEAEISTGIKRGRNLSKLISVCCTARLIKRIGTGKNVRYEKLPAHPLVTI